MNGYLKSFISAIGLLLISAVAPAMAACPYSGNTNGTDSAAMLNALNDICAGAGSSAGPSSDASSAIAPVVSSAAEACRVLKSSAGNLYSVSGYVGVAAWLMVFDATSAPADGAVTPKVWAYAATAGSWAINYGSIPARFATGITVCASTTGPLTKTAVSTNNVFSGNVQ